MTAARFLLGLTGLTFLVLWSCAAALAIAWDGWGDGATSRTLAGPAARLLLLAPLATFLFYITAALAPMRFRTALIAGILLQLPLLFILKNAGEAPVFLWAFAGPVCWAIYLRCLDSTEKTTGP